MFLQVLVELGDVLMTAGTGFRATSPLSRAVKVHTATRVQQSTIPSDLISCYCSLAHVIWECQQEAEFHCPRCLGIIIKKKQKHLLSCVIEDVVNKDSVLYSVYEDNVNTMLFFSAKTS